MAANQHAPSPPSQTHRAPHFALAFGLLAGLGALRKRARRLRNMGMALLLLAGGLATFAVSGCGGSGFFAQSAENYTITVTATAGNLEHTATFTLNVQ